LTAIIVKFWSSRFVCKVRIPVVEYPIRAGGIAGICREEKAYNSSIDKSLPFSSTVRTVKLFLGFKVMTVSAPIKAEVSIKNPLLGFVLL